MPLAKILQQTSAIKNANHDIRNAMLNISLGLCREQFINPEGTEFVVQFGHVSDRDNCQAISNWVYNKALTVGEKDQKTLVELISQDFERQLRLQ